MEKSVFGKIIEDIKGSANQDDSLMGFQQLSKEDKLKFLNSLKDIKDETAGLYLNALHADETDRDIQKQIRKLLFVLKTLGIKVEEPKTTGEPVLKKIEEVREHRALLSNYDDANTRLVVAAYELKKNAFIFLNASTHFSDGLTELMSGSIDKAGLEDILRGYLVDKPEDMTLVEISPRYASYLLEEASTRSGKYKEEINHLKKFTTNIKGTLQKPGDIPNLPVPEATRSLPVEKILEHRIFKPFSLAWSTIEEDKKAYNSTGGSTIILPPYMVEQKRQTLIEKLLELDELKSKIPLIKRLLEDYAYIFHSLNEFSNYKGLIEHLQDTNGPQNILLYFIRKSLEIPEEKQSGLIVKPYE